MSCGATISGRGPHPMCIDPKHAPALLAYPLPCSYCASMSENILERGLKVAVASCQDPCLVALTGKADVHVVRAPMRWADTMDAESPDMPPLFEGFDHGSLEDEEAEGYANDMGDMEEEEEDHSPFPTRQTRPSRSTHRC